jgi:hypothetical protein
MHENPMCALNKAVLLYKQKGALDTLAQGFCKLFGIRMQTAKQAI